MGTELDTGQRASGPPSAKLQAPGDYLDFAVVDIDNEVPVTKFGTNEPELRADGTPKLAVRLTVMAIGGNAVRKDGEQYLPIQPGEACSIFIQSYSKYDPDNDRPDATHVSWNTVLDRLAAQDAKFQVGTVGQWAYLRDIPSAQAGNNPRKDRKFYLRPAAPSEAAQSDRCEQLRVELKSAPATQLPPTPAPATPQAPAMPTVPTPPANAALSNI